MTKTNKRKQEKKRKRRKDFLYSKNIQKNKTETIYKAPKIPAPPLHKKIRTFLTRLKGKLLCAVGLHQKTLQSGLPGTPKYMCRRCFKNLKELW